MPIYIYVFRDDKTFLVDYFTTIYYRRNYIELLKILEEKYNYSYPVFKDILIGGRCRDPQKLLDELLELMNNLYKLEYELPKAYFFAVFPKDFNDVVSLILGGSSSITIPFKENVYRISGGLSNAKLYENEKFVRELEEGEELKIGNTLIKVFTRTSFDALGKPIKSLIFASLIAVRNNAEILLIEKIPEELRRRIPRGFYL